MKKTGFALCCVLLAALLAACSMTQHDGIYNNDTAIAGADRCAMAVFTGGSHSNPNQYNFTVSSISGAKTVWNYKAAGGEEIALHCTLQEENSGFAKLVLVSPSGEVTELVESSSSLYSEEYFFTAEAGRYKIKLVAKGSAKAAGQLEYNYGEGGSE